MINHKHDGVHDLQILFSLFPRVICLGVKNKNHKHLSNLIAHYVDIGTLQKYPTAETSSFCGLKSSQCVNAYNS